MLKQKKLLKLCVASIIIGSTLSYAKLINGISVLVNNEPITLYEIHNLSRQQNISLKESLNILIEKRLESSQVKKFGITASEYEVNKKIEEIAEKNNMTRREMLDFLSSKGMDEKRYREDIASSIKSKKLYTKIFSNKDPRPSKAEAKAFFSKNSSEFTKASSFEVTSFYSPLKSALIKSIENPMVTNEDVQIKHKTLRANSMDKKLDYYLNKTKINNFTPIIRTKHGYIVYQVNSKSNLVAMSFEEAYPKIAEYLSAKNQREAIKNYFQKLRSSASVEVLRKP